MFSRRHDTDTDTLTDVEERRVVDNDGDDTTVVERDREVVTRDRPITVEEQRVSTRTGPGQLLAMAIGLFFVIVGIITLIRAGIDGSLDTPVVNVLGFDRTAWVGVMEIGAGVLFVFAGLMFRGRALALLVAAAILVAGVIVIVEPSSVPEELAVQREYGWLLAIIGGATLLGFVVLPFGSVTRRTTIPAVDD
jgi:hypothetical protein